MNFFPRGILLLLVTSMISTVIGCLPVFAGNAQPVKPISIEEKLAELESASGGKIGIYALNTANGSLIQYRAEEHFPIQSTCKVMVVAGILKQSMTDSDLLQQKVTYPKEDLVYWSPITTKHQVEGMTIAELSAAAVSFSDNAATNLLMKKLGGPEAVTAFARSIGDNTFRLDNWEPKLNSVPGTLSDSSTPKAMGKSLQQLALGNVLATSQQEQLVQWMIDNTTGDKRIRAGVPKGWVVAEKTGSGDYGITNNIGIIWPSKCAPIVVSMYFIQNKKDAPRRDDVIASATRLLVNEFANTDRCIKL